MRRTDAAGLALALALACACARPTTVRACCNDEVAHFELLLLLSPEARRAPATDATPSVDPFRPTYVPPVPPAPRRPSALPPLALEVVAVADGDGSGVAVVRYQGAVLIVEPGFVSEDRAFEVQRVRVDRVVIRDRRDGGTRSFVP